MLKGPASILYQGGIGPVGGIINTVSKLPTENRFAEIGFTAGGYKLWNTWFDVNQPLNEKAALRVAAVGQNADGWRMKEFEKSVIASCSLPCLCANRPRPSHALNWLGLYCSDR